MPAAGANNLANAGHQPITRSGNESDASESISTAFFFRSAVTANVFSEPSLHVSILCVSLAIERSGSRPGAPHPTDSQTAAAELAGGGLAALMGQPRELQASLHCSAHVARNTVLRGRIGAGDDTHGRSGGRKNALCNGPKCPEPWASSVRAF